jgi:hypothetical protein
VLGCDFLKSKNQPILQLAQYSIQTKSEEGMVLEYKLDGCINYGFFVFHKQRYNNEKVCTWNP